MTHIEQLHLDAIYGSILAGPKAITAAEAAAEITENIACEFAIFFNGKMPMKCKEIMRRQDLPNEEKVKLVFQEYLKSK
jgi:hypothetical protein